MSFPLNLPTSSCANSVTITLKHVVGGTQSPFTLEEQLFQWSGEQWAVEFSLPQLTDGDTAEEWIAFALRLKGRAGTFLMGDPSHKTPRGVGGGSPLVDGITQAGVSVVNIKNAPVSTTGWLKRGDYVQFGSGSTARLHKLLADADTDSSGDTSIEITPLTRTSINDSSAVVINNPVGLFRMNENSVSWGRYPSGIYRFGFSAMEAL